MVISTMSTSKDKIDQSNNDFENNIDYEIQLLYAMQGHKPVGVSRYFQMCCICEKLQQSTDKDVCSDSIWAYLSKLYDLQQLDENESIPFPNEEVDFSLPDNEYQILKQKKLEAVKQSIFEHRQSNISSSSPVLSKSTPQSRKTEPSASLKDLQKSSPSLTKDSSMSGSKSFLDKNKKESQQRRDSTSTPLKETPKSSSKKELNNTPSNKKDLNDKKPQNKARTSASSISSSSLVKKLSDDDSKNKDDIQMTPKRTTRGSLKPDDLATEKSSRKSQSPLTVVNSANKRRRI